MDPTDNLPQIDETVALFLDFDGTLVPFADHPDEIQVPAPLPNLLKDLSAALGGALALVSGRSIADIDRHLACTDIAVAGEHGGQIRFPGGPVISAASASLQREQDQARRRFADSQGIVIEPKSAGLAIHYRRAPDLQEAVRTFMNDVIRTHTGLEIVEGKFVAELRLRGVSKGSAISEFMARQPFQNRRPVFVGDDVTDEDGFRTVNELDGISIKVGEEQTCADLRVKTVDDVYEWLLSVRDRIAGRRL